MTFCLSHIVQISKYKATSCVLTDTVRYTIKEIRQYFISLSKLDSIMASHMINLKRMRIYYFDLRKQQTI